MSYLPKPILAILALSSLTLFCSCVKEYDYVKQHPGAEVTGCRINMLIIPKDSLKVLPDTFWVHYNAFGDPSEMIASGRAQNWQGDYHFRYDKYHRLTDYFWGEPALSDYRLIWHRYTYIGKSLVSDSLFTYIEHGGGPNPPLANFSHLTIDSLDAEGRIIKATEPGNPPFIGYTNYNAKGNIQDPWRVYDNKLNIYHTSRVWMFIMGNYSVNNQLNRDPQSPLIHITSYNAAGLPLMYQADPGIIYGDVLFNNIGFHKLKVVYDCDLNNINQ